MLSKLNRRPVVVTFATLALVCVGGAGSAKNDSGSRFLGSTRNDSRSLARASELWLAPERDAIAARAVLARAVANVLGGRAADALPALTGASADPEIGPYARLYAGRAYLSVNRPADAAGASAAILASGPSDALAEAALNLAVEASSVMSDPAAGFAALDQLASRPNSAPAATQFRLLQSAIEVGNRPAAITAFRQLYFVHAASPETADAIEEMERIGIAKPAVTRDDAASHLERAEKLFVAAKYGDARPIFLALLPMVTGDDRELTELRLAECDVLTKKFVTAAPALRALAAKPISRAPEAGFHYLGAVKGSGRSADYVAAVREFVEKYANSEPAWAERALNDLGTYYVIEDDDESAAKVFAEQYNRFPRGSFADRSAWRSGWWAYKQGDYAETVRIFEAAATSMRRADYRPSWLYWAARAHLKLGHRDAGLAGLRRVIADYRNSYYGRAAMDQTERVMSLLRPAGSGPVFPASLTLPATIAPNPRPANASLIEQLLASGMFDEAIAELRRLQATGNGSPLIDATLAYALNRQGKLRPAITAMRRAYPQFMAEGGEALPNEILTVIFPIDHWNLLRSQAAARNLDPYLVAALVAQESTFQADIKSTANAWGLMQIVPATGRRYAATLGIRPFSTFRLIDPEVNVRLGTAYFSDLLKRFGSEAPALAAYNAGPERVVRWRAERQGFERDEFIDDIPYSETQNYVKRILGTAEDYRILYGNGRR